MAETPNIRFFVMKLHLLRFTRFFRSNIAILYGSSNIFATVQSLEHIETLKHIETFSIDKKGLLCHII